MKKILFFVLFSLWVSAFAQVPNVFKYQAVARDAAGDLIVNDTVAFQISLLQGSPTGTVVYTESHDTLTNNYGLVNLEIGNGTIVTGDFTTIDWSLGDYFLQIEMDETGGTNYALMGTSQLLSVPFALYAESSGNNDDGDWIVSGNDMYSNVTGKVGIGTTNPLADFELSDAGTYTYESAELRISLNSNGSNACPRIKFFRSHSPDMGDFSSVNAVTLNGDNLGMISFNGIRPNGVGGGSDRMSGWIEMTQMADSTNVGIPAQFNLGTTDYAGNRENRFSVSPEGNVGIGTSNPQSLLELYNASGTTRLNIDSDSGNGATINLDNNHNEKAAFIYDLSRDLKIVNLDTDDDADIVFRVKDNDEVLRLNANGNIEFDGDLDMKGNQSKNFVIENRTSDPSSPAVGQMWIRTDF